LRRVPAAARPACARQSRAYRHATVHERREGRISRAASGGNARAVRRHPCGASLQNRARSQRAWMEKAPRCWSPFGPPAPGRGIGLVYDAHRRRFTFSTSRASTVGGRPRKAPVTWRSCCRSLRRRPAALRELHAQRAGFALRLDPRRVLSPRNCSPQASGPADAGACTRGGWMSRVVRAVA
jgi:hypothetical protein